MSTAAIDDTRPVSRRVLDQAISWQLRLGSGDWDARQQQALERWLNAGPEQARAWRQLGEIDAQLRPAQGTRVRRQLLASRRPLRMLGALSLFAAFGLGLVVLDRHQPLAGLLADRHTATGEIRRLVLEDGSVVHLAARTALDVHFDAEERALFLRDGEIEVRTAHAPDEHRPLRVHTRDGSLRALGTRFLVQQTGQGTRLTVLEDSVAARAKVCAPEPADCGAARLIREGESILMLEDRLGAVERAAREADAWTDGVLVVEDAPLADVCEALGRYRAGVLQVEPAVAGLRVTGTFPLRDTERALQALAASQSLQVRGVAPGWTRLGVGKEAPQ